MMLKSINPYKNTLIKEYMTYSKDKVNSIINDVSDEFKQWKYLEYSKRRNILINIANSLEKNVQEHAEMITCEIGKPIFESKIEVLKCVWVLKYFADNAEEFLQNEFIKTDYKESYIQYEPLGVILGVMPWNFPYWQVFRFVAPLLMAGNTCIIKHASNVSGCSLLIEKVILENSSYKNIYKALIMPAESVNSVISNNHVKAVSLTGSEEAGASVAMQAGKEIKKIVLELGGSDPFIVLNDADVKKASKVAVLARFFNAGQSCIAAKRFLVHEDIHDEFVETVKKHIENLQVGDPMDEGTQIGPLAKKKFVDELHCMVQSSINDGAKCIIGGKIDDTAFYTPTLLIDVKENMDVFKKETFGPVLCIMKIANVDEAINIANNSQYGLGGSIWTENIELAKRISCEIDTGAIFINEMTKSDPRLPFGGINKSGYGIELSKYGIKEFVNTKTIVIN